VYKETENEGEVSRMESLITLNELSVVLKVPKSWVYKRTMKKGIPGQVKLGKHLRFRETAISGWILRGCPESDHSSEAKA
jgi:excisionase family DNA binding protein